MTDFLSSMSCNHGIIQHAQGAWPHWDGQREQTHSWHGSLMIKGERIYFECKRIACTKSFSRIRPDYIATLDRGNNRELTSETWEPIKAELLAEFKRNIFVGAN